MFDLTMMLDIKMTILSSTQHKYAGLFTKVTGLLDI